MRRDASDAQIREHIARFTERTRRNDQRLHHLRYLAHKYLVLDPVPFSIDGFVVQHKIGPQHIDYREMMLYFRDQTAGGEVGYCSYQICHKCRVGKVWKIHTAETLQRQGIATAMLSRARWPAPGYRWETSGLLTDAKQFWGMVAERTQLGYQYGIGCMHIEAAIRRHKTLY
jgi:hypothetical protein